MAGTKAGVLVRRKADGKGEVGVLAIRLGERWLAVPADRVAEVMERRPVTPVPHRMGEIVEGMVNLRGELLMVVSLEAVLGLERTRRDNRRMLVIRHASGRFVFSADEVYAEVRYSPKAVQPAPAAWAAPGFSCITGVFEWGDRTVGLLDVEALVQAVNHRLA